MGDYTRIGLVRSESGFTEILTPSGTVNTCIRRGEGALRKYLGITPATGSQTEEWVEDASTNFAIHYLSLRLTTQDIANQVLNGQARREGAKTYSGYSITAEMWWNEGKRVCDMHGRNVTIQRISPN